MKSFGVTSEDAQDKCNWKLRIKQATQHTIATGYPRFTIKTVWVVLSFIADIYLTVAF